MQINKILIAQYIDNQQVNNRKPTTNIVFMKKGADGSN